MILNDFVKEKGISYYQIAQAFDKDPVAFHNHIKKKVIGEKTMTKNEYLELISILTQLTGIQLDPTMFDYEVERLKVK